MTYYYADSISYDENSGKYSLVNPYKVTSAADYPDLVGKYTFRDTTETSANRTIYYISYVSGSTMYYQSFQGGKSASSVNSVRIGDSITDNGNGTYTLSNVQTKDLTTWYTTYSDYKDKYICLTNSSTCENPQYITATFNTYYKYIDVTKKITLGKSINGNNLVNTVSTRMLDLYLDKDSYGDYKYTCGNETVTCVDDNI